MGAIFQDCRFQQRVSQSNEMMYASALAEHGMAIFQAGYKHQFLFPDAWMDGGTCLVGGDT